MKTIAQAALDALDRGDARIAGAAEILTPNPIQVWSGYAPLTIEGEEYQPLGENDVGITAAGSLGAVAQNINLTLSGIEPEAMRLLDETEVRSAPVTIRTLIFDSTGKTMLGQFVHRRGRVDRMPIKETPGGASSITVQVEGPGRGLGRRTRRMRSDADQRLINASDGSMRRTSFAGQKTLYWGGRRPAVAGSVVGGGGGGGGGGEVPSRGLNLE